MSAYIVNASFETDKATEDVLVRKFEKDSQAMKGVEGLLSYEVWKHETPQTVEFVAVSKWESKEAFKAWISRDEHVQGHKEQRQHKAEEGAPRITRKLSYYESYL